MNHEFYIGMSYAVTGLIAAALVVWVYVDGRYRRKELAELEAAGVRRRAPAKIGNPSQ
jgi:heme exporter protein D